MKQFLTLTHVRKVILFATVIAAVGLLTACHHDHEDEVCERVIMVYIADDNTGSWEIGHKADIRQMMEGTKALSRNQKVVAFVDDARELPYILEISRGDTTRVLQYKEKLSSSDATVMGDVLSWIVNNYHATSYGLVLWGHATGWEIRARNAEVFDDDATLPSQARTVRRAYAVEHGTDWMNIPDMARELARLPKLSFIFADCCCFQSIEVAYELRNVADYIIASAAEIPGEGAPYQTVVPALFSQADDYYRLAVDAYYAQVSYGYQEPMSVVKTSELANLAQATHDVLASFLPTLGSDYPDVGGLIYYYDNAFFDMNDFILRYADDNHYQEWRRAFDQAVVYKTFVKEWMANHVSFYRFDATEERYGGVNMFVPQDGTWNTFFRQLNETISRMQWYTAAGLHDFGW